MSVSSEGCAIRYPGPTVTHMMYACMYVWFLANGRGTAFILATIVVAIVFVMIPGYLNRGIITLDRVCIEPRIRRGVW